jgi:hypothetical protein
MRVKMIFALAAFLFFVPAVSQAVTIDQVQDITGTVAKVKWQVKWENGYPGVFTLTNTNKTIISDPAAGTNAQIDMDITDPMNHVISGYINVAGAGTNHAGGLYLLFSGSSLPMKNGSNKELFQGKIVQGYLLLDDGSAYNPPDLKLGAEDGFIGTDNDQVAVFSGTLSAAVVVSKDRSGNSIWKVSFTIYPNSAELQYIDSDIGNLWGLSTAAPAILTITIPPVKFTVPAP